MRARALGSLQALRERLSPVCAQVVRLLLDEPDRWMTEPQLRNQLNKIYEGSGTDVGIDLRVALEKLEEIKIVTIQHGTVHLVERIVIRL
jgi:hypothetical protein